jgi:sugar phosphate isomerase/epimerase
LREIDSIYKAIIKKFKAMISRRTFIKTTALTSVALSISPNILKAAPKKKNIGLQLYTLRDSMSTDLPGTLQAIAKTGYTWLEAAGYNDGKFYGFLPKEFKQMVDDLGMTMISSHTSFTPEQQQLTIDSHLELGVKYIVYPWMSMPENPSRDDYAQKAEMFNRMGEACKKGGLQFGYHNHNFEFVKIGDTTGYDLLQTMTDADNVCFECDLYWMVYAGVDPLEYFKKYPGRFELWHVKDMEKNEARDFAPVGTGTIDFQRIFAMKELAGMQYFFVEQDQCKIDPFDSVEISYDNLLKIAY